MIYLFLKDPRTQIASFNNYEEVCDYIHKHRIYLLKRLTAHHPLETMVDLAVTDWRFSYYKFTDLNIIYSAMREPPVEDIEKEAFDQGLDLIEICQGHSIPEQIPVTPEVEVEELRKAWCFNFCTCHGLVLMESAEGEKEIPDDVVV